jgi:hypothetical protein
LAIGTATGANAGVMLAPGAFATRNGQTAIAYPPPAKATFTASWCCPSASVVVSRSSW